MRKNYSIITIIIFALILSSCNAVRVVEPLKKGQSQISANVGGPLFYLTDNLVIPMPLSSISYAKGISEKTTGFASIHTTSLMFGNIQSDFGLCRNVIPQKAYIPGVSLSTIINFMWNMQNSVVRAFPQIEANAYWHIKNSPNICYLGYGSWFDLTSTRAFNEPQSHHTLMMLQAGYRINRPKWTYFAEMKWIQPSENNQKIVVDYVGIQHKGALGIYLGIGKNF